MSEQQHPDSRGFEQVAELYERSRPGYPPAALAWFVERLGLGPGRNVLDLGAGTGKLTRGLVATGAGVVAVEPGDRMRAQLVDSVPKARALAGAAEAIPLADASVDAVTAGQAFHWFRLEEAVPEVRRVLRPGGGLALIWNERDRADPLQQAITSLLSPFVPPWRSPVAQAGWRAAIEDSRLFMPFEERSFRFAERLDAEGLVDRIATISFVAAAGPDARGTLESELRALAGDEVLPFRYLTQAFVTIAV